MNNFAQQIEVIDMEKFFVRKPSGDFEERPGTVQFGEVESLLENTKNRKICVEYCLQILKAKKVVRLRMKYASKHFEQNAFKIEEAYFMLNTGVPQFGGLGCGTFFSNTLQVTEIEKFPKFLINVMQNSIVKLEMRGVL